MQLLSRVKSRILLVPRFTKKDNRSSLLTQFEGKKIAHFAFPLGSFFRVSSSFPKLLANDSTRMLREQINITHTIFNFISFRFVPKYIRRAVSLETNSFLCSFLHFPVSSTTANWVRTVSISRIVEYGRPPSKFVSRNHFLEYVANTMDRLEFVLRLAPPRWASM